MKRLFLLFLTFFVVGAVRAQPVPENAAETVRFLRQSWARVRQEGPKAIDDARLAWPGEIRRIKARVGTFSGKWIGRTDPVSLRERAVLLAEFWRIRGSINLLGLLSAENLKAVTGMDLREFQEIARQVGGWKIP
ncbi:MAG TPA: hypothetical protein VGE01_06695 [Fimbriimonas sp.]